MTPELQKAIERVRALRNLGGNNPNEHEVKAAMRAADKVMREFQITQAMLEAAGQIKAEPLMAKPAHTAGKRALYKEVILNALCNRYGCYNYVSKSLVFNAIEGADERQMQYIVVGRESDVEIVNYLFDYLVGEGLRLTAVMNKGKGKGYGKSWLEGFGMGIAEQVRLEQEEERKVVSNSTALVFLDKRAKEAQEYAWDAFKLRKSSGIRGAQARPDGKAHGYNVGKNISIRKGMGGSNTTVPKLK